MNKVAVEQEQKKQQVKGPSLSLMKHQKRQSLSLDQATAELGSVELARRISIAAPAKPLFKRQLTLKHVTHTNKTVNAFSFASKQGTEAPEPGSAGMMQAERSAGASAIKGPKKLVTTHRLKGDMFLINPADDFIQNWSILMLFFLGFTATVTPFEVCFLTDFKPEDIPVALTVANYIVDMVSALCIMYSRDWYTF
jgi:hypothetical protein